MSACRHTRSPERFVHGTPQAPDKAAWQGESRDPTFVVGPVEFPARSRVNQQARGEHDSVNESLNHRPDLG
ncbi:hypothetical protein GCM10010169_63820 [Micromonospora fulviviridis]|nr:hypothetical protein GCM10010169_63820 [Micromonospora fulviviridis]